MRTTLGKLLINESLPEDLRDDRRTLDKKGIKALLREVAEKHPDQYRRLAKRLSDIGREAAYSSGGQSFGLRHLQSPAAAKAMRVRVAKGLQEIYTDRSLTDAEREKKIIELAQREQARLPDQVFEEAKAADNPLAHQVESGARGNRHNLNSVLGGDLLYTNHKGDPIPVPVTRSYAQGLSPAEYFASSYGARKGIIDLKAATQDAGFLAKQLQQASHRLLVSDTDDDEDEYDKTRPRGLPVNTDDADSEGALLSQPVGGYGRNTVLTPKILKDLRSRGIKNILVRSPTVGGPADGGVFARDVGVRERGTIAPRGDFVGVAAAQALAEPITQAQICLAGETRVRMADWSVKEIRHIRGGDWVLGADKLGNTFPVQVLRKFDNGVRECVETFFRIPFNRDRDGFSLVSTPQHKVLMLRKVTNCADEELNNVPQVLPVGTDTGRIVAVRAGAYVGDKGRREPMALLVGLLLGDGCYTQAVDSCNFSCHDDSLIDDVAPLLALLNLKLTKLAGHEGYYNVAMIEDSLESHRDDSGRVISGRRNPARRWLESQGLWGKYAHEKELPACVRQWDNTSVSQLLGGYFVTDGSVYTPAAQGRGKPYLGYGSTSLGLLYGVRDLLQQRFGIYPSGPYESNSGGRKRPMYYLNISTESGIRRFLEHVPLYGVKRRRAAEKLATWAVGRPNPLPRLVREKPVPVGQRHTYDLEVDHPDHLFVLESGLIVSNSSKHSGGIAGAAGAGAISGFKYINQLVQVPKRFQGGARHAQVDGTVTNVEKAPQGGHYVSVGNERHYVGDGYGLKVKIGDKVEAGDTLSEGIPNPAEIVRHKGVGEGRRYFIDGFRKALEESGVAGNRRNIELLSRGLINHVRVNEEVGDFVPGDRVPYQAVERAWTPREGSQKQAVKSAVGKYLERPVLHYTVGTRLQPSMAKTLEQYGVSEVETHEDPPPFEPEMVRAMENVAHDPDWMTRFLGAHQQKSLLRGAHRGDVSDTAGTSFVPALSQGKGFGQIGKTRGWDPEEEPKGRIRSVLQG